MTDRSINGEVLTAPMNTFGAAAISAWISPRGSSSESAMVALEDYSSSE
jgi:hypothetical protein